MSKGRDNKLAGQIGEYLVCAELGRRGLIATPFSGNVPAFDILAADDLCRTVPIQVKVSRGDSWRSDVRNWMNISFDPATKAQQNLGPIQIQNPELIYVCVAIVEPGGSKELKDRFFILRKAQLQAVCIKGYSVWMAKHEWKRPRTPESYDCRYSIPELQDYEDNWQLILDRLAKATADPSLETTEE
jgi:hypothetical protein